MAVAAVPAVDPHRPEIAGRRLGIGVRQLARVVAIRAAAIADDPAHDVSRECGAPGSRPFALIAFHNRSAWPVGLFFALGRISCDPRKLQQSEKVRQLSLLQASPGAMSTNGPAKSPTQSAEVRSADICRILGRAAPLVAVARTAAESDDEVASLYAGMHRGRRQNLTFVIDALLARGPLRVDRERAVTTLTRLVSPELFLMATQVEGASPDDYERWLQDTLSALLLPFSDEAPACPG